MNMQVDIEDCILLSQLREAKITPETFINDVLRSEFGLEVADYGFPWSHPTLVPVENGSK